MPMPFFGGLFRTPKSKPTVLSQTGATAEFNTTPAVTPVMESNINLWYKMYIDNPPWVLPKGKVVSIGLPSAICREVARPALVEYRGKVIGSPRADYINAVYQKASHKFLQELELGLAVGGIAFKPYLYGNKLVVDASSAMSFTPTKYDPTGKCIGGIFKDILKSGNRTYVRLEEHSYDPISRTCKITNKAHESNADGNIGKEISLSSVKEWAGLEEEVEIPNVDAPLFAYFEVPKSNNIEVESHTGISIYGGAAVDLIRQADEHWELMRWEFESGQRKILMDGTQTTASQFNRRLFEIAPFNRDGNFYEEFSPEYRESDLYSGFQSILKQIEFQVGLSYGTISDPQSVEKTATEIRNSKQRMYVTISGIQRALEETFDDLIDAIAFYTSYYSRELGCPSSGEYHSSHDWGDSIIDDIDTKVQERANDRQDMAAGIMSDWEYRAKWYKEDEATAKKNLPKMADIVDEPQNEIE